MGSATISTDAIVKLVTRLIVFITTYTPPRPPRHPPPPKKCKYYDVDHTISTLTSCTLLAKAKD